MPVCPACAQSLAARTTPCPQCGALANERGTLAGSESGPAIAEPASPARTRRQRLPQAEAWQAVIGERGRSRYLRRFQALERTGGRHLGWHWPAFVCTSGWLIYRKMWGWAAVYLFLLPLLVIGERQFASAPGTLWTALDGFTLLAIAVCLVAPGLIADRLYLHHCNRLIARTRRDLPLHKYVARLAARGGTSVGAAAVAGVFATFAVAGVVAGVAISVVAEAGKRGKVVEALNIGAGARAAVAAFVARQGTVPATLREAGYTLPALPAHVSRFELDPRTGTIEIVTQLSDVEAGAIYLVPQTDAQQRIVWSCRADPAIEAYTPRSCQTPE